MAKNSQTKKIPHIYSIREKQITLAQHLEIQLLEDKIKEAIKELNTIPRLVITAFFIPLLTTIFFKSWLRDWDELISKWFIKLHLRSDELDPVIASMTGDYLEAQSILLAFDEGQILSSQLIQKIHACCQQFSHSELLKNLNFTPDRFLRFTQECRLSFASMSALELRESYKIISDKLRVVRSLSVEDVLSAANKKQLFSSVAGVMLYNFLLQNTFEPLFNYVIRYPLFINVSPFLAKKEKNQLAEKEAHNYLATLKKNQLKLARYQTYQHYFFRWLLIFLLGGYIVGGLNHWPVNFLFLSIINVAFSGLLSEIKLVYKNYQMANQKKKQENQLKLLFMSLNCQLE